MLDPESGDALLTSGLRTLLRIHGGALATEGPWKGDLRPTNGCLRLSNDDMIRLRLVLAAARAESSRNACVETTLRLTVLER